MIYNRLAYQIHSPEASNAQTTILICYLLVNNKRTSASWTLKCITGLHPTAIKNFRDPYNYLPTK
jgi:hypothetical protein